MNTRLIRVAKPLIYLALLLAGVVASAQDESPRAWIRPSLVTLKLKQQQQFFVAVMPARLEAATALSGVNWFVNEIPGGNDQFGTIGSDGTYTAPAKAPHPREVRIGAKVGGTANRYLWATIIIGDAPLSYKHVGGWGDPADNPARMRSPHGLVVDQQGNVIVVDELASRVFRFAAEGKYLGEIGLGPGREPGQFSKPRHAAVDADGLIYVSDEKSDRPRLQVFTSDGEFLRIFAEKGTAPGMLLRAHGMQFDHEGRLFIVDVDNARVSVFDRFGEFLRQWGKDGLYPGELNAPHGLVIDPNGDVFVSGYYGPVQKFTSDGRFLFAFGYGQPPDGPVHFHAIGGDPWGNVYVTVRNLGTRPTK